MPSNKKAKPRSLSGLVKQLRREPKPRQRIVDILAYAAVKHTYPARLEQLTPSERNAARREKADVYNTALADSKTIAALLSDPEISDDDKQKLDTDSHAKMEKLLLAKIELTLDMLDIPATGSTDEDIFAIGMQCIGNVDTRFTTPPPKLNAFTDPTSELAEAVAVARFFNLVLYDIKTEEILKGRYPDLQNSDNVSIDPVLAVAKIYQSLFEIRMLGKKPTYRLKGDVFKNEQDAQRFEDSLERVEMEMGLMSKRPETIKAQVEKGRSLLDGTPNVKKASRPSYFFKRRPADKKQEKNQPKQKKPWL